MNAAVATPAQRALRYGLSGFALLVVALAVLGGVRAYSPVPYWDMWQSYLPFLDQAANGGWPAWWQQHNEHRITLARLFFWADLRWFDGAGWFLIVVNYVLVGLGALLFCRILRDAVPARRGIATHALACLLVCLLFFWSQYENLTWGFQSQFILAQLLPLAALYALYRSIQGGSAVFALACLLGVLSAGTMANGVLALPLMTVYALLTRQGWRRSGLLAALAAVVLFAYFHHYVPGPNSLGQALRERPGQVVRYALTYLGGPFHFVLREGKFGLVAAQAAGLFLLASALRFAWPALRSGRQAALPLALLCFIAFIAGTALVTAGGRSHIGIEQALSYRYTTPTLMAWSALLVLYAPALLAVQGWRRRLAWGLLGLLALMILAYQWRAQHSRADEMFDRAVAGLAVELRIKDMAEIGHIYPDLSVLEMSEQPAQKRRSVFGLYPYRGALAGMGTGFQAAALPACRGALEFADPVEGDGRYLRVGGWLAGPSEAKAPQAVRLLDAGGRQVGYALAGKDRRDVAQLGQAGRQAGFRGYLAYAPLGRSLTLRAEDAGGPICQLAVQAPAPAPFIVKAEAPSAQRATVGTVSVTAGHSWSGADFFQSHFPGMRVYGSYLASDADQGAIVLRIQRGDRLFYRSGPSVQQQSIEIEGVGTVPLPLAPQWVLLEFSGEALPQQPFTVKLSDQGGGWGEWSAIALNSN